MTGDSGDRSIIVVGGGGHAKVAIEALRFSGWSVIGCTDADTTPRDVVGAALLGGDELLPGIRSSGVRFAFPALGGNALRERIGDNLLSLGFEIPSAFGPNANVSPSGRLGRGVAVFAGASINADTCVGDFAIINTGASVDHDGIIGRAAHVGPGCSLAGCVHLGARAFLGVGVSVIPGIRIGSDTMVGAGSVVVRHLPDRSTALGVPARVKALSEKSDAGR